MNVYTKVAQAVIRLFAFALVVLSLVLYLDDLRTVFTGLAAGLDPSAQLPALSRPGVLTLKAIPIFIAIILCWKNRALAEHLTKDLD